MECMECHKRPATLHITQVINGQKLEQHVCESCTQHKGYTYNHEDSYALHELLTRLTAAQQLSFQQAHCMSKEHEVISDQCPMSLLEFRRVGRFGCAKCYHNFKSLLYPTLLRIHSASLKHQRKIP